MSENIGAYGFKYGFSANPMRDHFLWCQSRKIRETFAATIGTDTDNASEKILQCMRGNDKVMLIYGIDLTGIEGKKARMDYLMNELKEKFTAKA